LLVWYETGIVYSMESYLAAEFRRQADARRAPAYQHLRRTLQHAVEKAS